MSLRIDIQKKDLWLLSAVVVFLVGAGFVVAWDSDSPVLHGHTANEIEGALGGMEFGDWTRVGNLASGGTETMVIDHVYQAQTDGIITVYGVGAHGGGSVRGYTDTNNPPTTIRTGEGAGYVNYGHGISFPVKKNDYFKIERTSNWDSTPEIYWLPILSSPRATANITDVPSYRVKYKSAVNQYSLSDFNSYDAIYNYPSLGYISGGDGTFPDGSYLFEMKVKVKNTVRKNLYLRAVDNYFQLYLDGTAILNEPYTTGEPHQNINLDLSPGEHIIQIIFVAGGAIDYFNLFGDIVDKDNVNYVSF